MRSGHISLRPAACVMQPSVAMKHTTSKAMHTPNPLSPACCGETQACSEVSETMVMGGWCMCLVMVCLTGPRGDRFFWISHPHALHRRYLKALLSFIIAVGIHCCSRVGPTDRTCANDDDDLPRGGCLGLLEGRSTAHTSARTLCSHHMDHLRNSQTNSCVLGLLRCICTPWSWGVALSCACALLSGSGASSVAMLSGFGLL